MLNEEIAVHRNDNLLESSKMKFFLQSFLGGNNTGVVRGDEEYVRRLEEISITEKQFLNLHAHIRYIGVTKNFREIIDYFKSSADGIPAGFRVEWLMMGGGRLLADLVRDVSYGANGVKKPTNVLFSADTADPYEVEEVKHIVSKITTNPAIIYDRFIHNPSANINGRFKTREEVLEALANVLGPGVDISVELNNPFASEQEILEEIAQVEQIVSKYRLVVKVPHLGPITEKNLSALVAGNFPIRHDQGTAGSAFYSHNLALMLREHGYRVNFTLMFEPYQSALALQARPAYINCFVRNRYHMNEYLEQQLALYDANSDENLLVNVREQLIAKDYLSCADSKMDLTQVEQTAREILRYRRWNSPENKDGLDQARHSLRLLKSSNMPLTKLIICSLDGQMFAYVDAMLQEKEFSDMNVIISVSPEYLAQFASAPDVITYNRSFIQAVQR